MLSRHPRGVRLLDQPRELPDGAVHKLGRRRKRQVTVDEPIERPLLPLRFEPLREELTDRRTPVEALLVEVRLEFGFEVLGDAGGDSRHGVCYVYILYKRFGESSGREDRVLLYRRYINTVSALRLLELTEILYFDFGNSLIERQFLVNWHFTELLIFAAIRVI